MIVNTMTMGILSIYFAIVFAYELTSIERDEQKLNVNPLTGHYYLFCILYVYP